MRKRFRGNQPISVSTELEAGAGSGEGAGEGKRAKGGMLYAGKGMYEGTGPKGTSGREMDEAEKEEGEFEVFVRNDGIEDLRRKK